MHYPITNIQANFGINRPIRCQITRKENIYKDDRKTISIFFKEESNTKK